MKKKRIEVKVGDLVKSGFVSWGTSLSPNQYYRIVKVLRSMKDEEIVLVRVRDEDGPTLFIKKYMDSPSPSCVYLLPGYGWEVYSYSVNLEKILE